ncbi:MAG: glycosyltransferase family 9 protein [Ignavibacteriales bacterium]|nr:glycosyltransferase family 9 protein [Ignavibacteriales bacterium]
MELILRYGIVYPVLRLILRNPQLEGTIDLDSIRSLLILRYDRLGDIVVTTPVLRRLKELRSDLKLGVLASSANAELLRGNPHVDRIHVLPKSWFGVLRMIRQARIERYDVVLNFIFNRTTSGGILANLISPKGIKVGQGAEQYGFYFNKLLSLDRGNDHMAEVLMKYVDRVFGLQPFSGSMQFEVFPDRNSTDQVSVFLTGTGFAARTASGAKGFTVLNISAAEEPRSINLAQMIILAAVLTRECDQNVVLISAPSDRMVRRSVAQIVGDQCREFPERGDAGLLAIAALIGAAQCVVTPDTSVVHIASAMKTPVLAFYTPLQVTNEWLPMGIPYEMVLADPGKPVSSISPEFMRSKTKAFIHSLKERQGA